MGTVQGDNDFALGRLLQRGCSLGVGGLELPSDEWSRLRTLTWPAGDAGSNICKIRAPSRNDVRAPTSACMRSSSGVQRTGSNSLTGEKVASSTQGGMRQRQILYRGASTSTVPNRVCSRRSFTGWKVRQSGQTLRQCRYSATCPRTIASCNLVSSAFASARESPTSSAVAAKTGRAMLTTSTVSTSPQPVFGLQPDRPFHEQLPRSRSMGVTPPNSLPTSQGCPRLFSGSKRERVALLAPVRVPART